MTVALHSTAQYTESTALPNYGSSGSSLAQGTRNSTDAVRRCTVTDRLAWVKTRSWLIPHCLVDLKVNFTLRRLFDCLIVCLFVVRCVSTFMTCQGICLRKLSRRFVTFTFSQQGHFIQILPGPPAHDSATKAESMSLWLLTSCKRRYCHYERMFSQAVGVAPGGSPCFGGGNWRHPPAG